MKIKSIWDNQGETFDRYTVVFEESLDHGMHLCLGLSSNPESPLGFSQFSSCQEGAHLGDKIEKLPENLKKHIDWRIT